MVVRVLDARGAQLLLQRAVIIEPRVVEVDIAGGPGLRQIEQLLLLRLSDLELRNHLATRLFEGGDLVPQGLHLALDIDEPHLAAELADVRIGVLELAFGGFLPCQGRLATLLQLVPHDRLRVLDKDIGGRVRKGDGPVGILAARVDLDEVGLLVLRLQRGAHLHRVERHSLLEEVVGHPLREGQAVDHVLVRLAGKSRRGRVGSRREAQHRGSVIDLVLDGDLGMDLVGRVADRYADERQREHDDEHDENCPAPSPEDIEVVLQTYFFRLHVPSRFMSFAGAKSTTGHPPWQQTPHLARPFRNSPRPQALSGGCAVVPRHRRPSARAPPSATRHPLRRSTGSVGTQAPPRASRGAPRDTTRSRP